MDTYAETPQACAVQYPQGGGGCQGGHHG